MIETFNARLLALLLICLLPMVGCKSRTQVTAPQPIPIEGIEKPKVEGALRTAIPKRGWAVDTKQGQVITASNLIRGRHKVVVDIDYASDAILIQYADSENMDYVKEGDVEYIHKNYNVWVNYLRQDIAAEISTLRF
ncbi:MAG: hypothetical protein ACPGYV_02385 [Phycisphaeraceae bacterium]